jgi:hypothetical protein
MNNNLFDKVNIYKSNYNFSKVVGPY